MSFIVLVALVTLPVLLIVEEDTGAAYFVSCALVFVVCISILGFIFGPKIWAGGHQRLTLEAVKQSIQTPNTENRPLTDGSSELEGALILEHPKTNELYRKELQELREFKKEWEKANASKATSGMSISNEVSVE